MNSVKPIKDEAYDIAGAAMSVLNVLGHGFNEKVYENAFAVQLKKMGIPFQQQQHFDVVYESVVVGYYVPDFIVNDLIVEIKTIDKIGSNEIGQVLNYLKVTNLKAGIILNFKNSKLEWKRVSL